MNVSELELPGVMLIEPRVHTDDRGSFLETWNQRRYADAGIDAVFVEDNVSHSKRGVLRGLHFQHPHGQAKLMTVLHGAVWDVVADVRSGSRTYGHWLAIELSASNARQLFVPPGFAHGFATLSDSAVFSYKCGEYYDPSVERTIRWDDPTLAIEWPIQNPILSPKDADGWLLEELPPSARPPVGPR